MYPDDNSVVYSTRILEVDNLYGGLKYIVQLVYDLLKDNGDEYNINEHNLILLMLGNFLKLAI